MSVYTAGAIIWLALLGSIIYLVMNNHPVCAGVLLLGLFCLRVTDDSKEKESDPGAEKEK